MTTEDYFLCTKSLSFVTNKYRRGMTSPLSPITSSSFCQRGQILNITYGTTHPSEFKTAVNACSRPRDSHLLFVDPSHHPSSFTTHHQPQKFFLEIRACYLLTNFSFIRIFLASLGDFQKFRYSLMPHARCEPYLTLKRLL